MPESGWALLLGGGVGLPAAGEGAVAGATTGAASVSPWVNVPFPAQLHPGAMLLLTNGSVMVQDQGPLQSGSRGWWLLQPNEWGSYVHAPGPGSRRSRPGTGP